MACFDTTLYVYTSAVTAEAVSGTSQTSATTAYSYFIQQSAENVGLKNRTLTLGRYRTYTFVLSSPWQDGVLHPFKFSKSADGTHTGGSEDIPGVGGSAGAPGEQVTLTIDHQHPDTFYYFSGTAGGVGGTINIDEACNSSRITNDAVAVEVDKITTRQKETAKAKEQFVVNNQVVDQLILYTGVKYSFFVNNATNKKFRIKEINTGRILEQIDGINVNNVQNGVVEFAPKATGVLEIEDGPQLKVTTPPPRSETGELELNIPGLLDSVPTVSLPACPVPGEIFYDVTLLSLEEFPALTSISAVKVANDVGATLSGDLDLLTQTLTASNLTASITGALPEGTYVDVLSNEIPVYFLSAMSATGTLIGSVTGDLGESSITETITGGTLFVPKSGYITKYNSVLRDQLIRGTLRTANFIDTELSGRISNLYLSSVSAVTGTFTGNLPSVEYSTDINNGSDLSGTATGYHVDDPDSYISGVFTLTSMPVTGGTFTGSISGETISETITSGTLSSPPSWSIVETISTGPTYGLAITSWPEQLMGGGHDVGDHYPQTLTNGVCTLSTTGSAFASMPEEDLSPGTLEFTAFDIPTHITGLTGLTGRFGFTIVWQNDAGQISTQQLTSLDLSSFSSTLSTDADFQYSQPGISAGTLYLNTTTYDPKLQGGSKFHYESISNQFVEGLISSENLNSASVSGYLNKDAGSCDLDNQQCVWNTTITAIDTTPWIVNAYALSTMLITGGNLSGHIEDHIVYDEVTDGTLVADTYAVVATSVNLSGISLTGTASGSDLSSNVVSGTMTNSGSGFTATVATTVSHPWYINTPTYTGTITAQPSLYTVLKSNTLYDLLNISVTGGVLTGTGVTETITGGSLKSAYSLSSTQLTTTSSGTVLSTTTYDLVTALSVLSALSLSGTIDTNVRSDLEISATATTVLSNQPVTASSLTGIQLGSLSSITLNSTVTGLTGNTAGGLTIGIIPTTASGLTGTANGLLASGSGSISVTGLSGAYTGGVIASATGIASFDSLTATVLGYFNPLTSNSALSATNYDLANISITGGVLSATLSGITISETLTSGTLTSTTLTSLTTVSGLTDHIVEGTFTSQTFSNVGISGTITKPATGDLSGTYTGSLTNMDTLTEPITTYSVSSNTITSGEWVLYGTASGSSFSYAVTGGTLTSTNTDVLLSGDNTAITETVTGWFSSQTGPLTSDIITGVAVVGSFTTSTTRPYFTAGTVGEGLLTQSATGHMISSIPVAGGTVLGSISGQSVSISLTGGTFTHLNSALILSSITYTDEPITGTIDSSDNISIGASGALTRATTAASYSIKLTAVDSMTTTLSVYQLTSIPVSTGALFGTVSSETVSSNMNTGTLSSTTKTYILTSDSLSDHIISGTVSGSDISAISVSGLLATLSTTEVHTESLTSTSNGIWGVNVYPLTSIAVTGGSIVQDGLLPPVTSHPYFYTNLNETLTGGTLSSTTVTYMLTSDSLSNHVYRGNVSSDELLNVNVSGSLTTTNDFHSGSITAADPRAWEIPTLVQRPVYDAQSTNTISIVTSTAPVVQFESRNNAISRQTVTLHDIFTTDTSPTSTQGYVLSTVNVTITGTGPFQGNLSASPTEAAGYYDMDAIHVSAGTMNGEFGFNSNIIGELSSTTLNSTTVSGSLTDHTVVGNISANEIGFVALTGTLNKAASASYVTGDFTTDSVAWTATSSVPLGLYYNHLSSVTVDVSNEDRIIYIINDVYSNANIVTTIRQIAGNDVYHNTYSYKTIIPRNTILTTLYEGESATITLSGIDSEKLYAYGHIGVVEKRCNEIVGVGTLIYPLSVGVDTPFTMEQKTEGIVDDKLGDLKYQWYYFTTSAGTSAAAKVLGATGAGLYITDGISEDTSFYCAVTGLRNAYIGSTVSVTPTTALNGITSPPQTALVPTAYKRN